MEKFQSWIAEGFDNYLFTKSKLTHRILTRLAKFISPFSTIYDWTNAIPTKVALKLNIPLIFYGENPEDYGNKK